MPFLETDDQATAFGIVTAKAPGRNNLNLGITPQLQDVLLQCLRDGEVIAMADGNTATGKPSFLHAVNKFANGLFRSSGFALNNNRALFARSANPPTCPMPLQGNQSFCPCGRF